MHGSITLLLDLSRQCHAKACFCCAGGSATILYTLRRGSFGGGMDEVFLHPSSGVCIPLASYLFVVCKQAHMRERGRKRVICMQLQIGGRFVIKTTNLGWQVCCLGVGDTHLWQGRRGGVQEGRGPGARCSRCGLMSTTGILELAVEFSNQYLSLVAASEKKVSAMGVSISDLQSKLAVHIIVIVCHAPPSHTPLQSGTSLCKAGRQSHEQLCIPPQNAGHGLLCGRLLRP